jgi:hypothetical protein
MTTEIESATPNAAMEIAYGSIADAIEKWLTANAVEGDYARLTCKANEVTLLAPNNHALTLPITPMECYTALVPFAVDKRFNQPGGTRNQYSNDLYILRRVDPTIPGGRVNAHVPHNVPGNGGNGTGTEGKTEKGVRGGSVEAIDKKILTVENKIAVLIAQSKDLAALRDEAVKIADERKAENAKKTEAKKVADAKLVGLAIAAISDERDLIAAMAAMQAKIDAIKAANALRMIPAEQV